MGWNRPSTKSLQNQSVKANISPGAPTAYAPVNRAYGYSAGYDINRAYADGMQKVTWVARCIDVIAGNQARLPVVLRKGNAATGQIMPRSNSDVLTLLNEKANVGENAWVFRYRLSCQLLLSPMGVFVNIIRSREGKLLGLTLLPPEHTKPIPDPRTFVSGYELMMPNTQRVIIPPDEVLWIRKPHPLKPYEALTPLESVGIAIEIENLAKIYNRNFLVNDGRPGMLLNVRGELNPDDREELESRFQPGRSRPGKTTVLSSDEGIDVIDLSSNLRDASYIQMREITKNEILAAFGVPEPALGNSSGRTFSNASEEMRGFWMETMIPHLTLLSRSLDELDADYYVDFDTSGVPVIILLKQERDRFKLDELKQGAISFNEYRDETGRKETKSELADSLLADPNLTPVANTKKEFKPEPVVDPNAPVTEPAPEAAAEPPAAEAEPPVPAAGSGPAPIELPGPPVSKGYSVKEVDTEHLLRLVDARHSA